MHFSTVIEAPARKVWDVMLTDETYRQWTDGFNPDGGSYFEGDWSQGSHMRFLGPDNEGNLGGMFSVVEESRPGELISLRHLGEIRGDKEIPSKEWGNSREIYTFTEKNGKTKIDVNLEGEHIPEEFAKMFEEAWPKALAKLKTLAEK